MVVDTFLSSHSNEFLKTDSLNVSFWRENFGKFLNRENVLKVVNES